MESDESEVAVDGREAVVHPLRGDVAADSFPEISAEDAARLSRQSLEDINSVDNVAVLPGMHMFFSNRFADAEEHLKCYVTTDPLAALGFGVLGTIRALLSMEQADVDIATKRLRYCAQFSSAVVAGGRSVLDRTLSSTVAAASALGGFAGRLLVRASAKLLGSGEENPPPCDLRVRSAAVFRAEVIHAECEVLQGILLLLQDTLSAYIKAGLALRSAYNAYDALETKLRDAEKSGQKEFDANSVEGVRFGLGCIHVVTSILPPKILRLLKALGYKYDRAQGFAHLERALRSKTLRSPLASLFLMAFHGILPSFAALMMPTSVPFAEKVMEETLLQFPDSVVHLWLGGRVLRLQRRLRESTAVFERCVAMGRGMDDALPQLKHFSQYDQAWNLCAMGQWDAACALFNGLETESAWSRKFFAYAQGACLEMLAVAAEQNDGDLAAVSSQSADYRCSATRCYRRAAQHPPTSLGGKIISADQFVMKRLSRMAEEAASAGTLVGSSAAFSSDEAVVENSIPMPGTELLIHFNIFAQIPTEHVTAAARVAAGVVEHRQRRGKSNLGADAFRVLRLIEGFSLRREGRLNEALQLYEAIVSDTSRGYESWIAPYAMYEAVVLTGMELGDWHRCASLLEELRKRFGRDDYCFEMQMQLRIHLANDVVSSIVGGGTT
jgi:hypothetical protein